MLEIKAYTYFMRIKNQAEKDGNLESLLRTIDNLGVKGGETEYGRDPGKVVLVPAQADKQFFSVYFMSYSNDTEDYVQFMVGGLEVDHNNMWRVNT